MSVPTASGLPYKLACLCDLRDERGRVLLIHRNKSPNLGLCSPIGGKLDVETGESPTACAQREILEEAGVEIAAERLHLGGLVSEAAFEGRGHWLLFYFRVLGAARVEERSIPEGELRWHEPTALESLPLPLTDRSIIWPVIRAHEGAGPGGLPGFFAVHVACEGPGGREISWSVQQSTAGWLGRSGRA